MLKCRSVNFLLVLFLLIDLCNTLAGSESDGATIYMGNISNHLHVYCVVPSEVKSPRASACTKDFVSKLNRVKNNLVKPGSQCTFKKMTEAFQKIEISNLPKNEFLRYLVFLKKKEISTGSGKKRSEKNSEKQSWSIG